MIFSYYNIFTLLDIQKSPCAYFTCKAHGPLYSFQQLIFHFNLIHTFIFDFPNSSKCTKSEHITVFEFASLSEADALKGELRSQASACFTRIPPTFGGSLLMKISGLDGSRTRVQKPIPCPSTSVVCYLTFPPPHENKHPCGFSSFMIRPQVQSLACVVSHIVEAWVLKCECSRSDCCHQAAYAKLSSAFNFNCGI